MKRKLICLLSAILCAIQLFALEFEKDGIKYILDDTEHTYKVKVSKDYKGDVSIAPYIIYNGKKYTIHKYHGIEMYGCKDVTSVQLPTGIELIDEVFSDCTSLSSIIIPNTVTEIWKAFGGSMSSLKSINIPASVEKILSHTFDCCSELEEINVAPNNKKFASVDGVLYSKDLSCLIKCPNNKKGPLSEIFLPETTTICEDAFAGHTGSEINIPASITKIGFDVDNNGRWWRIDGVDGTFDPCPNLLNINVAANNPNYTSIDGILYSKDKTILLQYPSGRNENKFTIPPFVKHLKMDAFKSGENLNTLIIPATLEKIDSTTDTSNGKLKFKTLVLVGSDPILIRDYEKEHKYTFEKATELQTIKVSKSLRPELRRKLNSIVSELNTEREIPIQVVNYTQQEIGRYLK